jgi:hypothetical protein
VTVSGLEYPPRTAVCIVRVVVQAPGPHITLTTNPDIAVAGRERSSSFGSAEQALEAVREFLREVCESPGRPSSAVTER